MCSHMQMLPATHGEEIAEVSLGKVVLILALTAASVTLGAGCFSYLTVHDSIYRDTCSQAVLQAEMVRDRLNAFLCERKRSAGVLADFNTVRNAVAAGGRVSIRAVESLLFDFCRVTGADLCCLLDEKGREIALGSRKAPCDFIDDSDGFRASFQQALRGTPSIYVKLKDNHGKGGLCFSHPVLAADGETVAGVALVGFPVDLLDRELREACSGNLLIAGRDRVVFWTTRKEWLHHVLWEGSHEGASSSGVAEVCAAPSTDGGLIRKDVPLAKELPGKRYLVHQVEMSQDPGWKIVHLSDMSNVSNKALEVFAKSSGFSILALFAAVAMSLLVLYRKANQGIAHWKRSEKALMDSEKRFRTLFELSPQAILLLTTDGKIIDGNEAAGEIIRCSREELMQMELRDLFTKSTAACLHGKTHGRILDGDFFGELEISGKDGVTIPVELTSRTLELNGEKFSLVVLSDITERKEAQNAVLMSEERFSKAFHSSPAPTALSTVQEGIFIDVNTSFLRMLGYGREELIGRSSRDVRLFEHASQREVIARRCREVGSLSEELVRVRSKSGEIRDVLMSVELIRFGGENFLLSLFNDVTERKRAETNLRESEEKLRLLSEFAPFGIALMNEWLEIEHVNPRFTELFGHTQEELVDFEGWLIDVCPDLEQRVLLESLCHMNLDASWEMEYGQVKDATALLRSNEGTLKTFLLRSVAIRGGKYLLTAEDITFRKCAEEALRESEEKYRLLVDNANEAIFIAQNGIVKFPNPFTIQLTGFTGEELASIPFVEMIHPEDREMVLDYDLRILSGQKVPGDFSFRLREKKGKELWVQQSAVATTWEGLPATLNFLKDITEQKQLELQLLHAVKMEAVGTLAGGIAHDFNNLLQAILGYADLIRIKKPDAETWARELQEIVKAARRGSELVRQLLTFSRKIESKLRPLDLNHEVTQVSGILERTIPKMISIELSLASDLKTINADSSQLEQVLVNLAVNARDAMPAGGKLTIRTENVVLDEAFCAVHLDMKPGEYVLLEVTDTGHGMDQKTMERVFEPFFTTKEAGKGTGLGLPMVYGIVKNHGGFIICDSILGHGTAFSIYLPVLRLSNGIDYRTAVSEELKGGIETILVIDDEEAIRSYCSEVLSKFGYTVLTAESSDSALKIYAREWPTIDLVMIDLIMPNQSGMECLDKLLKINPLARIIIASGHFPDAATRKMIQDRAGTFIQKPYGIESLLKSVRRVLEEKS